MFASGAARDSSRAGSSRRPPPGLAIVWEKGSETGRSSTCLAAPPCSPRERWSGTPIMAGMRRGAGFCLWLAVPPGRARLRALPLPLAGLDRSRHGAAVFLRALVGVLSIPPTLPRGTWILRGGAGAASGVAALHVAACILGSRPEQDAYLEKLIAACHPRESWCTPGWSCRTSARNPGLRIPSGAKNRDFAKMPSSIGAADET